MVLNNSNRAHIDRSVLNEVQGDQINNFHTGKPDINQILAPVIDAAYTRRGPVVKCLQGTREDVIEAIDRWVEKHSDRPICWLKGPAGYGKSAISQAVAEKYAAQRRLGASFFFLRGAGKRSSIDRLIPTISNQLSVSVPATKPFIQRAIETEPHITNQSLQHQFQKLVVEPILASRNTATTSQEQPPPTDKSFMRRFKKLIHPNSMASKSAPCRLAQIEPATTVIVIDALDECDDKDPMGEFIETIINACSLNSGLPLRFIITSRIEEHIRRKLETSAARSVVHHLSLEEFEAHDDIREFFRSSFDIIYEENRPVMRNVSLPWPSVSELHSLVEKSGGSFIFAATLMNVIGKGSGLPQNRLKGALTAEAGLDTLYSQVLSDTHRDDNFERVIGTLMLLRHTMSITSLAQLLRLQSEEIVQTLLGVQSILMIPGDDSQSIQLFHTSLRDYLTSQQRSNQFFIDPPIRHLSITIDCLSITTVRPENGVFYDGVQKYACFNWCYHLHQTVVDGGDHAFEPLLLKLLKDFVCQSLDLWVNTILLDGYKKHMNALYSVLSVLVRFPHFSQHSVQVLNDIRKNAMEDIEDFRRLLARDWEDWEGDDEWERFGFEEFWNWEDEWDGRHIINWRTHQTQQWSQGSFLPTNSDNSPQYQVS